jgi:hypothetical protein
MDNQKKKSIDDICKQVHDCLEKLDSGLNSLREFIMGLEPQEQSNELLGAYENILNYLNGIASSKTLPSLSYNQKNGSKEYIT